MHAGCRKDRSTIQQILMVRLIAEKAKKKNRTIYNCFVHFQRAFDSVKQKIIWVTPRSFGLGYRLVQSLQNAGWGSKAAVKIGNELVDWFSISFGTKQGNPASPSQFIAYLERVMDWNTEQGNERYNSR